MSWSNGGLLGVNVLGGVERERGHSDDQSGWRYICLCKMSNCQAKGSCRWKEI